MADKRLSIIRGVTIVRLTRMNNNAQGGPRWRVLLSDGTDTETEDGAPVAWSINNTENAGLVDVQLRGDRIIKVTPSAPAPAPRRGRRN